jgi:hypothetical protein
MVSRNPVAEGILVILFAVVFRRLFAVVLRRLLAISSSCLSQRFVHGRGKDGSSLYL